MTLEGGRGRLFCGKEMEDGVMRGGEVRWVETGQARCPLVNQEEIKLAELDSCLRWPIRAGESRHYSAGEGRWRLVAGNEVERGRAATRARCGPDPVTPTAARDDEGWPATNRAEVWLTRRFERSLVGHNVGWRRLVWIRVGCDTVVGGLAELGQAEKRLGRQRQAEE